LSSKSTFSNSTSQSYALALYELSKENSELAKTEETMNNLKVLMKESLDFKETIMSPTISKEEKKNVLIEIAKRNNFSNTLKNFLGLIANKNRLFFLDKIIESFLNLTSNIRGELKAKLTSSKELSQEEKEKIKNELSKNFKFPLNIDFKYDPNLIAGLVIQVGSTMIDTSIKTQLSKLEKDMLEA
tara:strand:- start:787 stop:1344 length:558 start_codon:yes stop_codon:yes gene_type:complete